MLEFDAVKALLYLLASNLFLRTVIDMFEEVFGNVAIKAFQIDLLHEFLYTDLFASFNVLISIDGWLFGLFTRLSMAIYVSETENSS